MRQRSRSKRVLACGAIVSLAACRSDREFMVLVDTDMTAAGEIDRVEIDVRGPTDGGFVARAAVAGAGAVTWPVATGVRVESEASGPVSLRVRGLRGADEIVVGTAVLGDVPAGSAQALRLDLRRVCAQRATPCGPGTTCDGTGSCVPDGATLVPYAMVETFPRAVFLDDGFATIGAGTSLRVGQSFGAWAIPRVSGTAQLASDGDDVVADVDTPSGYTLIETQQRFGDFDITLRMQTLAHNMGMYYQTARLWWHVAPSEDRFDELQLGESGWSITRGDPTATPSARRLLDHGDTPAVALGTWAEVRVRQIGADITVWIDGTMISHTSDGTTAPYEALPIGLVSTAAHARFSAVHITPPRLEP